MMETWITVLATALLTSTLTLVGAYLWYQRRLRRDIERKVEQTLEELARVVGERVRQGVLDAVASLPSTEVLKGTQRSVLKVASELVEGGLDALLGKRRKPDDR